MNVFQPLDPVLTKDFNLRRLTVGEKDPYLIQYSAFSFLLYTKLL